jgi:hypothetical protein
MGDAKALFLAPNQNSVLVRLYCAYELVQDLIN